MKFNNILNKHEYLKISEGVSDGGSGGSDRGFANNAALQETLLGQLLNGVFKSVSWLWRKSKEYFVIDRLIGRLTNELLRGVIVYCFDNDINIQTGESSNSIEDNNDYSDYSDDSDYIESNNVQNNTISNDNKESTNDNNKQKELDRNINELDIIRKDIPDDLINPSKKTIKNTFGINFDINKVVDIKNVEQFQIILNELYDELKRNVPEYPNMTPNQKNKVQQLYKNYFISKNIVEYRLKQNESKINEAFKKSTMSDPKSGSDPLGKKIKSNVKVSDILTKRDKEKYKKHEEEMSLRLSDINLAEIENVIEKRNSKSSVSEYINVENLKTIQLTAEELFLPVKTDLFKKPDTQDKTESSQKLRLKWNKEIRNVYASFSNLMLISENIDISVKDFRNDLTSKLKDKAHKGAGNLRNTGQVLGTVERLSKSNVFQNKKYTFNNLDGQFSLTSISIFGKQYLITFGDVPMINIILGSVNVSFIKIYNAFNITDDSLSNSVLNELKLDIAIDKTNNDIWLMFINKPEVSDSKRSKYLIFHVGKDNLLYLVDKDSKYTNFTNFYNSNEFKDDDNNLRDEFINTTVIPILRVFSINLPDDTKKQYGFINDGYRNSAPLFIKDGSGHRSVENIKMLKDFYNKIK